MVHIYNGILLSHRKNTFEPVLMKWMNLEPIVQSEVSQKEKDRYCILMHIYMESRKMVLMIWFAGQQRRHRHEEQTCGHSGGEGEWDDLSRAALKNIHYNM